MDIDDHLGVKQDIWVTHGKGDHVVGFEVAEEYYDKYNKLGYDITFFKQDKKVNHDANSGIREQIKNLEPWFIKKL